MPARFVPPGALAAPGDALGLVPRRARSRPAPTCSPPQLRPPRRGPGRRARRSGRGRRPVEIAVSGAEALLAPARRRGRREGRRRRHHRTERQPGPGRTYVAAAGVPLLALGPGAEGPGPGGASAATLGLTRRQALRLIAAESFARKLTLLPEG